MDRADAWRDRGQYFSWRPRAGDADEVQIFHVETGDADAPPLVLVHGFPTSSIDWFEIAERLGDRYRVCAMDFPGFGFSDKPLGWGYSLVRDAEVLEHYVAEVLGLESMIMLAHDRGSSVAMIHATGGESRVTLEHLFLTNGNIFLPLSNLTQAQRLMLDPATGPDLLARAAPEQLAVGMGQATFSPPRGADDPEIRALTAIFAAGTGLPVLHETIQYLVERSQDEDAWLRALAAMDVPTTFIWGLCDTVAPPRVISYVWNEYMMSKPGRNSLYFIPDANHYLQNDRPDALVDAFMHALEASDDVQPGAIAPADGIAATGRSLARGAAAGRRPPDGPRLSDRTVATETRARPSSAATRRRGTRANRSASHAPIWGVAVRMAVSWVPPGTTTSATGWCQAQSCPRSFSVRAGTTTTSDVPCTRRIGAALGAWPGSSAIATDRAGSVVRGSRRTAGRAGWTRC